MPKEHAELVEENFKDTGVYIDGRYVTVQKKHINPPQKRKRKILKGADDSR